MSMHQSDWKALWVGVSQWFKDHPKVSLVLGGIIAGVIVTLILTA